MSSERGRLLAGSQDLTLTASRHSLCKDGTQRQELTELETAVCREPSTLLLSIFLPSLNHVGVRFAC